ncbi:helix-turn-helix domain-containing protein [Amycolatopsis sp. cg5]|uniref:helix-turn-helix domain-containing protein n=1 Tax=Amycolatopsis sp. cg5 TaxID=3238802 RepID=UPI003523183D
MTTATVRRLQVGQVLRTLRESAGFGLDQAGKIIGKSASSMSRIERGITGLPPHSLKKITASLGAAACQDVDVDWVLELGRGSQERGRWSGYRRVYDKHARMAIDLEEDSSVVKTYCHERIPDLLQAESYLRAQLPRETADDVVEARLERQWILTRNDPAELRFVLSESALRRMVGDREVMRAQLAHLARTMLFAHVQVQVLPFRARTAPRASYDFQLFRIPSPTPAGLLRFVYRESYTDGHYLDEQPHLDAYDDLWRRLTAAALGPEDSRDFVLRVAGEYL